MSRKNLLSLILTIAGLWSTVALGQKAQTPVEKHGFLRVEGNRIVDQHGQVVQLRGMSLCWSQWFPKHYNYETVKWLRDDWRCDIVRASR